MTARTLWQLLREHNIDLLTAQHICNDAMNNGVTVPDAADRIAALEAVIHGWQLRATVLTDHIEALGKEIAKLMDKHGIAPAKPRFWRELDALISTVTSAERAAPAGEQDK